MSVQGNAVRNTDRQSWQLMAANSKAEPMHRAMALVRLKNANAKALHDKCLQILHDV